MIFKEDGEWYFRIQTPDGETETYGPYELKKEAECDARGIKQFYSLNEKELKQWKKSS